MRALRIALGVLGTVLLVLLATAGMLWLWSSSINSLATSLELVARHLPAGQTLEVKDIKGSLERGGTIGWLRWQQGELEVQASHVNVSWVLPALLQRELRLDQLTIGQLRINDQRPSTAASVPTDWRLPIRVETPFSIDTLAWVGPAALQISELTGHYAYDDKDHRVEVNRLRIASGMYRGSGRLQAQAPMTLLLQVQGTVQKALPAEGQTLRLRAHASLRGDLSAANAILELRADLEPELPAVSGSAKQARQGTLPMQASVTARIQPWQAQAVASANVRWQALDLAALWPQAPQTLMTGDAAVTPVEHGWRSSIQFTNSLSGPWDRQQLPISKLDATLLFAAGLWTVESLQASAAGGRVQARGKLGSTAQWQGSASAHGINPAALDSRMTATALDGQLAAQRLPSGIAFEASLQAAKAQSTVSREDMVNGLRIKTIHTQGHWQEPLLVLDKLTLQTDDAQLQGRLSFNTVTQAAQGQLGLNLPGGIAALKGDIARSRGQGEMSLRVHDAKLAASWLTRWPGVRPALGGSVLRGGVEFTGAWQGGWQDHGQELHVQASARASDVELQLADEAPGPALWRLRDWHADVSGTLRAWSLNSVGQIDNATRHFALQLQAHGGRVSDGLWQAQLDTTELSVQDSVHPGIWLLQLSEPVALDWRQSTGSQSLNLSAGKARLTGPIPGNAAVNWQAAQWSLHRVGKPAQAEWRTQGGVQALPLAWLDQLGQTRMANLGLHGDMVFGGQWDLASSPQLRLRATLERSSGDLQLQTDANASSATTSTLSAGVRVARIDLGVDGDQVVAKLRWDSERAGQMQADFQTRLQRRNAGWVWPSDAPLTGTVRAQLPSTLAWSLLAPPGWRLQGTLAADTTLSGTRAAPQWHGTLQAQDLALRSVADGIDFSQGTLRASLSDQRLDIESFTLHGAGGKGGGLMSVTGSLLWLPAAAATPSLTSRLRIALDAQARTLRVSSRADQRLIVSGNLTARLDNAGLTIRGALKADQALFILPQDTAPELGDDVIVRPSGDGSRRLAPASASLPLAPNGGRRFAPDLTVALDLGENFEVRGPGLRTHLTGTLELRSTPERALLPQLYGQLRTVRGSYKAFGQQLDIEEGQLRFSGPIDNPALDILTLRPNLPQHVGVQIRGSALSPVVRLYADPDLPEAEKLAWLVLGRAPVNGGTESAMLQQATLALLGPKGQSLSARLTESLGLDELSVRGIAASNADGSAAGATVTIGKRVSRNFYVAYERSLSGALGTFHIFYDLSRRLTLRAQTGEQSAVDLIFTLRYD